MQSNHILALCLSIMACIAAYYNINGWGWFLVVGAMVLFE